MVWYIFMIFCSNQFLLLLLDVVVVYSVSHVQLFWDPIDHGLPDSSVHGISHARTLEWVAVSSPRETFPSSNQTLLSCIIGKFFTTEPPGEPPVFLFFWGVFLLLNEKTLMPIILAKGTSSLMNNYLRNIIDK